MKIYISGKIAGDPDYKGKFARAAAQSAGIASSRGARRCEMMTGKGGEDVGLETGGG